MKYLNFGTLQLTKVEKLSSWDLRREAACHEETEMWKTDEYNAEQLELLWLPSSKRSGIAVGAIPDWTDASSPEDALRRFFDDDMID